MTIKFTLTAETSGTTQSGDYRISGTTDGGAVNGVFIASGITRAQLTTGYTATGITDTITGGTITSTGSESGGFCTNQINWYADGGTGGEGTARVTCQLQYTNAASGDIITVSNNTTGTGTVSTITSSAGITVNGNTKCYVDEATGTTVTFTVQKTSGNGLLARDIGSVELLVNLSPIDSFNFFEGGQINDTLTAFIEPTDIVSIVIQEG
jgi:hypothetical protein